MMLSISGWIVLQAVGMTLFAVAAVYAFSMAMHVIAKMVQRIQRQLDADLDELCQASPPNQNAAEL